MGSVYIRSPHAWMREEPAMTSRIASDAIHSEEIEILEQQNGWVKIRHKADGYTGWIKEKAICQRSSDFFAGGVIAKVDRLKAHIYGVNDTEWGPICSLPRGSRMLVLDELEGGQGRWLKVRLVDGREAFIQRGDITKDLKFLPKEEVVEFSKKFLGLPYAWGGRSTQDGFDCSGFVQMLYAEMGISIPRDSKDQFVWDYFMQVNQEDLQPGDLVFFGRPGKRVSHVGMYLGEGQFIHSAVHELQPIVRINSLKDPYWTGSTLEFRGGRRFLPKEATASHEIHEPLYPYQLQKVFTADDPTVGRVNSNSFQYIGDLSPKILNGRAKSCQEVFQKAGIVGVAASILPNTLLGESSDTDCLELVKQLWYTFLVSSVENPSAVSSDIKFTNFKIQTLSSGLVLADSTKSMENLSLKIKENLKMRNFEISSPPNHLGGPLYAFLK